MVHNGIEYGLMAAYAEGLNILKSADEGLEAGPEASAERLEGGVAGDESGGDSLVWGVEVKAFEMVFDAQPPSGSPGTTACPSADTLRGRLEGLRVQSRALADGGASMQIKLKGMGLDYDTPRTHCFRQVLVRAARA